MAHNHLKCFILVFIRLVCVKMVFTINSYFDIELRLFNLILRILITIKEASDTVKKQRLWNIILTINFSEYLSLPKPTIIQDPYIKKRKKKRQSYRSFKIVLCCPELASKQTNDSNSLWILVCVTHEQNVFLKMFHTTKAKQT